VDAGERGAGKKSRLEQIAEAQAARNAARGGRGGGGRGRGGGGRGREEEVDPMDPSAYSDAPRGGWGAGLEAARDE